MAGTTYSVVEWQRGREGERGDQMDGERSAVVNFKLLI